MAKEALNFQITMIMVEVVGWVLTVVFIGSLLILAAWILRLIFSIIAFTKVQAGENYKYPLTIRIIK
jgi:uncharacterized Tic20 family protein